MFQQRGAAPLNEVTASRKAIVDTTNHDDDDEYWLPKELQKPPNQCQLTEEELNEEFTRILNCNNPKAPQNIARYKFIERTFKCSPNVDHLVVHLDISGYLMFKSDETEEKQVKIPQEEEKKETAEGEQQTEGGEPQPEGGEEEKKEKTEGETNTESAVNTEIPSPAPETVEKPSAEGEDGNSNNLVKNPFNFSERGLQTFNNLSRDSSTNTEPPPKNTFSSTVTQWSIFDEYVKDLAQKEKNSKEKPKPAFGAKNQHDDKSFELPPENHFDDVYYQDAELKESIKKIERMTNQNTHDEITQDFKYWDDMSDEIKGIKNGCRLLPLWRFVYKKEKKKNVTALCWNPCLSDFFAVGYGSYNFSKQGPGLIACFTLKNPSYPEFMYNTTSGVMCLDFYPKVPSLIAVGMYDGTIAVYNLAQKSDKPLYKSTMKTGKHTDPVWEIKWQKDDLDDNPNFFSVSSDGRIIQWTLLKNELKRMDVIVLRNSKNLSIKTEDPQKSDDENEDSTLKKYIEMESQVNDENTYEYASGSCFDFNSKIDSIFVVGTEEGYIYKCSTSYNKQYLMTYEGHHMAIYSTKYNKFHPKIFLSASADWSIKLWDHDYEKPIITFDLNSPVTSVEWSPYSSTIFAAVTNEGKIYVYELNEKKYEPVCEQQIVRKSKLTHIRFNKFEPIILVGDDRGNIYSLKLPPSLRKHSNDPKDEMEKIDKIVLTTSGRIPSHN